MKQIVNVILVFLLVGCNKNEDSVLTYKLVQKICSETYFETVKKSNYEVKTYLDNNIQNSAESALLHSLKECKGDAGYILIMETTTGQIKALVSLEKGSDLLYDASNTKIITKPIEPGGLIKPFNLMSLLEDNKADTSAVYDAKGGEISFYGQHIKDIKSGFNKLSLKNAFLNSSSTIFAQAINNAYKNNPKQYIDNFKEFGLSSSFSQISSKSIISSPKSDSWAGVTLPWMGFGYGVQVTPIQLLTYYNAIANNGVMVEPLFLNTIKKDGKLVKEYTKPIVIKTSTSKKTNAQMKSLLRDAVLNECSKEANSSKISISGYAGITQLDYSKGNGILKYASSFVGYFPSNKPKYTVLVYITNPNTARGFFRSAVAENVVKSIAEKIY